MNVLLVDSSQYAPTTPFFSDCLGKDDLFFDQAPYLSPLDHSLLEKAACRLLRRPLRTPQLNGDLERKARKHVPDVLLVVKGQWVRPETLQRIKRDTGATLVCFQTDNPWNPRVSSRDMADAVPVYDHYCHVQKSVFERQRLGFWAREATHVLCGYHPKLHYAAPAGQTLDGGIDVTLVGGADEDRLPFGRRLAKEADRGVFTLALLGGYWDRDPLCRKYAFGIVREQYRAMLWRSKVAVALVRRANGDDHSMKTFELPACGVFTLFEDTATHRNLFGGTVGDGSSPFHVFFKTPADLVAQIQFWLANDEHRKKTAETERWVVTTGKHTWHDRYREIMQLVGRGTQSNEKG